MKVLEIQLHTDRITDAVNLQIECGGKDRDHSEKKFINKISKNARVPKAQIPRSAGSQLVVPHEPLEHTGTSSEHSDLKAFLVPSHWLDGERSIIVEHRSNVWHLLLAAPSIEHGVNDNEVDRDLYERMSVILARWKDQLSDWLPPDSDLVTLELNLGEAATGTALANDPEPLQEDGSANEEYTGLQEGSTAEETHDLAEIKFNSPQNELEEIRAAYLNLKKDYGDQKRESTIQLALLQQSYEEQNIRDAEVQKNRRLRSMISIPCSTQKAPT